MNQYQKLIKHLLDNGQPRPDRTGVGTISVFGYETSYDISNGTLPLETPKEVSFKNVLEELLWILRGDTNIRYLTERNVGIWNEWADKDGEIGPMYGYQWTNWNGEGINQIQDAIDTLRIDPTSRRVCVSAWNPSVLPTERVPSDNPAKGRMALAPCHAFFQFYADFVDYETFRMKLHSLDAVRSYTPERNDPDFEYVMVDFIDPENPGFVSSWGMQFNATNYRQELFRSAHILRLLSDKAYLGFFKLSCKLTIRSQDVGLGYCYNVASYSLLTMMMASVLGMDTDKFLYSAGDAHIYQNHISSSDPTKNLKTVLEREAYPYPKVLIAERDNIFDYTSGDFHLQGYEHHGLIKLPRAV